LDDARPSALLSAYLAKREDLKRYFTLRLRSPEAAEDLVQDMYVKVSGAADADVSNPVAFLYRMGSNLMLDRIKHARRSMARDGGWQGVNTVQLGGETLAEEPGADDALAARQRLGQVVAALDNLSPTCRRAFRLHKLEGLSHAETAAAMGISKSAIEKHISTALRHLLATVGR